MRYFIRFSYDGSKFYGFQRLNDCPSIQSSLEEALTKIDSNPVIVKGAGRTDRGVHARGQCAHFDLLHDIPVEGLASVLNKLVGPYIYIKECRKVSSDFHARFSVIQKKYTYRIYLGEYNPRLFDYVYECAYPLDISLMKEASQFFLGVHDFRHFVSGDRDQYQAVVQQVDFQLSGEFLDITFIGKSFYRYMIRNLVGSLLDVGMGKRDILEVQQALINPSQVKQFSTAISNGLYLDEVIYDF